MTTEYGEGPPAQRTCAAADRTGHAILHTLYGKSISNSADFFIEYFAIDLIMTDSGKCVGVVALCMETGELHRFHSSHTFSNWWIWKSLFFCNISPHLYRRWICYGFKAGLPLQDMEFVQFHPTGIYGAGCLITEGCRGEGGYLVNSEGERFMERYAPKTKDLASRDVVSRAMTIEIREGRGVERRKIIFSYILII